MAEETYTQTLYNQLNTIDPTYGDDVSFDKFESSIKDKGYASQVYSQLNQADPTYGKDVPFTKFYNSVNPPEEKNIFQRAWGSVSDYASSYKMPSVEDFMPHKVLENIPHFFIDPLVKPDKEEFDKYLSEAEAKNTAATKFSDKPVKDDLPEKIIRASILGSFGNASVTTTPNSKKGEPDVINVLPKDAESATDVNRIYQESTELLSKMGYGRQADGSFKKIGNPTISPEEYESYVAGLNENIKVQSNKILKEDADAQLEKAFDTKSTARILLLKPFGWEKWLIMQKQSDPAVKRAKDLAQLSADLTGSVQKKKSDDATTSLQAEYSKSYLTQELIDPKTKEINFTGWQEGAKAASTAAKNFRLKLQKPETIKEFQSLGIDMAYAADPKNKALLQQKFGYINPDASFSNWMESVNKASPGILGTIGGTIDFLTNGEMSSLDGEAMYLSGITPYKQQFESSAKQLEGQIKANDEQIAKILNQHANLKPGYVVSPEGKKQLQDLQNTNKILYTTLNETNETIKSINSSITKNTKTLAAQEGVTQWMEDKYNNAGVLTGATVPFIGEFKYGKGVAATAYFLRGLGSVPNNAGALLKTLGAVSTDNAFKVAQILPSQDALTEYTPKALTESISNAVKYDPKNGVSWDGVGLWYAALKTGAESAMLGTGGALVEGLGARLIGEVGAKKVLEFGTATTYKELAGQYLKRGLNNLAYGAEWAAKEGATWGLEGTIGYVAPSILMFGNEMIQNEIQKGLSLEEATKIGLLRASIEGLTEKLNPLEMNVIKSMFAAGKLGKNIGESIVFKELMRKELGMSARVYDFLYGVGQFVTKGSKQGIYESIEEEVGLWMNDQLTRGGTHILGRGVQEDNPGYTNDEPFNGQNIINTALTTMATMLPMSAHHGYTEAKEAVQSVRYSRFIAGSNPNLYTPIIAQQLQKKQLTEKGAIKALQIISNLHDVYNQATPDFEVIAKSSALTGAQKKEKMVEVFDKHLQLNEKAKELETLLPELRIAKLEELAEINKQIQDVKEQAEVDEKRMPNAVERYEQGTTFDKFTNEDAVLGELNDAYHPQLILNTKNIDDLKTNLEHIDEQIEEINELDEDDQPSQLLEKFTIIKHNIETRIKGIEENKHIDIIDDMFLQIDPTKASSEGDFTQEEIAETENVPLIVAQKMAELQDFVTDRGFSVYSDHGKFGITNPAGEVIHVAESLDELETFIKQIGLVPKSTGEMQEDEEVQQSAPGRQYNVGDVVELSPNITPEEKPEESEPEESVVYTDGSTSENTVQLSDVPPEIYIESTYAQVEANNKADIASLGTVEGQTRVDGNIVYEGDKLVFVPTLAAYEARQKSERQYIDEEGRVHERMMDESNLLNPEYLRLHSNEIAPGLSVVIRVKDIESSRFVQESKDRFRGTIDERIVGSISLEEQRADLEEDDNFREIEVYDTDGKFLFNLHTIAYIRPARVATSTETDATNLNTQYQAIKEFRQSIIAMHNSLKESGQPTDINTTISGKATGKLSVAMDNEYAPVGRRFKNPAVLSSIGLAPTLRQLQYAGLTSVNYQPAGSVGVLIPTPNGKHFALQVSPQALNTVVINSIITSIKLGIEYRSLLNVLNPTAIQKNKLSKLTDVLDKITAETGFRLYTIDGIKNYIKSFTHVSANTSTFLLGAERNNLKDVPFIDFDAVQEKITFSRGRNFDAVTDLDDIEGVQDESKSKLKQSQYRSAGVRRINMFISTKDKNGKAAGNISNPGLNDFLDEFAQYLKGRRFNFNKDMVEDNVEFKLPILTTKGVGSAATYHLMSDQEKEKAGIASKFKNYKAFILSNVTTNVLEHTITKADGKTEYVYFEQPNISLSPILNAKTAVAEEVHGSYKGLKVVNDVNLKASTGEPGGAQFNRDTKQITINRPSLQQKFDEKAWLKPRTQKDGSQATALAENTFTTYQDWENFVMEHEFQHSVVSRQEFDALPENENRQTTTGEYEDFINNAALAQLSISVKQEEDQEKPTSEEDFEVDKDWSSLGAVRQSKTLTLDNLTDFTQEEKESIKASFADKHGLSEEEALADINNALSIDREGTINKLKECF